MMASSRWPAAEALTYGSSSTLAAVKSVHFGQQQQQTALQQAARGQQKMEEAERAAPAAGETKDALAEATIGLVIAANLALTFVRDVRRERMAAKSGIVQQAPSRFSMTARPDAGSFRTVARPFVIHSAILSSRGRCNSNGMKNFSPLFRPV